MSLFTPPFAAVRRPRFGSVLAALAASVRQSTKRFVEAWRHRHEAAMLVRADEHILRDLGLSRDDVRDAFSGPPWEDPTVLLRARALERRLSRHRAGHGFPPSSLPSPVQDAFRRDRPSRLTLVTPPKPTHPAGIRLEP